MVRLLDSFKLFNSTPSVKTWHQTQRSCTTTVCVEICDASSLEPLVATLAVLESKMKKQARRQGIVVRAICCESIVDGSDGLAGEILDFDLAVGLERWSEAGSKTGQRAGAD